MLRDLYLSMKRWSIQTLNRHRRDDLNPNEPRAAIAAPSAVPMSAR